MQTKFIQISNRNTTLCDVITGDDSWFYHKKNASKIIKYTIDEKRTSAIYCRSTKWICSKNPIFHLFLKLNSPFLFIVLNRDKLLTISHTSAIVYDLLSKESNTSDLHMSQRIKIDDDNGRAHIHKNVSS
jgi:hypothetical protein